MGKYIDREVGFSVALGTFSPVEVERRIVGYPEVRDALTTYEQARGCGSLEAVAACLAHFRRQSDREHQLCRMRLSHATPEQPASEPSHVWLIQGPNVVLEAVAGITGL